jgi:hypothetical protein
VRIDATCPGCGQNHGFDYQGLRSISLESGCGEVLFNDLDTVVRLSKEAERRETRIVGSGFDMVRPWA